MLFNSFIFLIFAAVFFLFWGSVKGKPNLRYLYIIIFSFAFYMYATPWWILLLIGTALLDYLAGLGMLHFPDKKKLFMALSLTANLGLLFYFKYQFFVGTNLNALFHSFGTNWEIPVKQLALPIGISFYTFQSMSYTIAAYRGALTPTKNILHFYAYVSLWPQLVAGPIEKAVELLPQLEHPKDATKEDIWEGLNLIVRGYFKKMVIADNLAPSVNAVYNAPEIAHSMPLWWVASIMFAIQIYCDFSGYTDIARGFAQMMGFKFMLNFDHPYGAVSVTEFWRKWHISLSTWFRDYVYIPLGGNRKGEWQGIRNMWITMLVSGIWHGAAWTFVIWGALHAFYTTVERKTHWPAKLQNIKGGRTLSAAIVFGLVVIAWVFFRANTLPQALSVVGMMLNPTALSIQPVIDLGLPSLFFFGLGMLMILNHFFGWSKNLHEKIPTLMSLRPVSIGIVAMLCIFWRGPGAAFIYFQF